MARDISGHESAAAVSSSLRARDDSHSISDSGLNVLSGESLNFQSCSLSLELFLLLDLSSGIWHAAPALCKRRTSGDRE